MKRETIKSLSEALNKAVTDLSIRLQRIELERERVFSKGHQERQKWTGRTQPCGPRPDLNDKQLFMIRAALRFETARCEEQNLLMANAGPVPDIVKDKRKERVQEFLEIIGEIERTLRNRGRKID